MKPEHEARFSIHTIRSWRHTIIPFGINHSHTPCVPGRYAFSQSARTYISRSGADEDSELPYLVTSTGSHGDAITMVRLGSNTKVYRSYGKRQQVSDTCCVSICGELLTDNLPQRQHTVNKAATAKEWRAGSVASSDSSILSYKSALEDVSFVSNQPVRSSHPPKSSKVHKDSERTAIVLSSDDENDDEDSRIIELSSDSSVAFERSLVLSDESEDEDDVELDSAEVQVDQTYREKTPAWLVQLLASCTLDHVIDFQDFVTKPPRAVARTGLMDWVKVGEASYSEVFRVGDTVVKIMPLADPSTRGDEIQAKSNWPMLSNVESVEREIKINASVDKIDGFVGFKGAYVVRGSFPENLLVQWDLFHEERVRQKHAEAGLQCKPGQSNRCLCVEEALLTCPADVLPAEQYYVLICLEDGGVDLEAFRLRNWREARNVFQQTSNALARAEERFDFEVSLLGRIIF